jgi:hypothetical protein
MAMQGVLGHARPASESRQRGSVVGRPAATATAPALLLLAFASNRSPMAARPAMQLRGLVVAALPNHA